jgi:phosphatidate cytidylyltransferase
MLKQRVITALILLAVVLPTLFFTSPWPFCGLALLFIAAGAWEWAKLNGMQSAGSICFAGIFIVLAALSWYMGFINRALPMVWILATSFWVLISVWLLKTGVSGWTPIPVTLRRVGGMFALLLAWLAVSQARVQGVNFLISVLTLVWVADSFAYFAGRTWGGKFTANKLAPSISPGKSWEGVWGGMFGVLLLAMTWVWADNQWQSTVPSLYSRLHDQNLVVMAIALLFLAAMSVVGDLIESLIKRSAGVKDSSGLLPGHGGVLDRVDALLPTLPIAMMLVSLVNLQIN